MYGADERSRDEDEETSSMASSDESGIVDHYEATPHLEEEMLKALRKAEDRLNSEMRQDIEP